MNYENIQAKPFPITPSTNYIDVVGKAGHSFEYAIADLIDNSLSAHAKNIWLYFDYLASRPFVYILDDGDGMTHENLMHAAVFGDKPISSLRSVDDLGRYSIGLKSATKSFCFNVLVSSKKEGEQAHTIRIDYKHISGSKTWEAFDLGCGFEMEQKLGAKGTSVYCDDLTWFKSEYSEKDVFDKLDLLEKKLSHIFGKYILQNHINIYIQTPNNLSNPAPISGWNPFGLPENQSTKLIFSETKIFHEQKFTVSTYILPISSNLSQTDQDYMKGFGLLDQEGFYVYRNRRLIKEGGWLNLPGFSLDDKVKYSRIDVELPNTLDEGFSINFSKDELIVPQELISYFSLVAKKARTEAKKNLNYMRDPRLKPSVKTREEKVWNIAHGQNGTYLSINKDHPIIAELCEGMSKKSKAKLLSLLSKSVPVKLIESQETLVEGYSSAEIMEYLQLLYKKLKEEGKSTSEIKTFVKDLEPFKSHIDELCDFFGNIEEDEINDK